MKLKRDLQEQITFNDKNVKNSDKGGKSKFEKVIEEKNYEIKELKKQLGAVKADLENFKRLQGSDNFDLFSNLEEIKKENEVVKSNYFKAIQKLEKYEKALEETYEHTSSEEIKSLTYILMKNIEARQVQRTDLDKVYF